MINDDQKRGDELPQEERADEADDSAEEVEKIIPLPKWSGARSSSRARPLPKSDSGTRRMVSFVIFESIFLLITLGFCGYMFYINHNLKKSHENRITVLNNRMEEASKRFNDEWNKLEKEKKDVENKLEQKGNEYKILRHDRDGIADDRDSYKSTADDLKNKLDLLQAEQDTALRQFRKQVSALENSVKQLRDTNNSLEDDKKAFNNKLMVIEAEYNDLRKQTEQIKLAKELRKKEIERQYIIYAPEAMKIIAELKKVQSSLETGLDVRRFVRLIKGNLDILFEEFKIKIREDHHNFLSFKLISKACHAYEETAERWRGLARTSSLPKGIGSFVDKVIRFEQPIEQYRPWVDPIQILWQKAALFTNAAGAIIDAQESFDPNSCLVCKGNHTVSCPKCAGAGVCIHCHGKGFLSKKGKPACSFCAASKKCSFCLGKKEISCPVCSLAIGK